MEEIHERFVKWTMRLDWRAPGYMVREEIDIYG